MTTKQFKFPTFAHWATESYRRIADKDLFGPTPGMGQIEENIAERFFKEWRRFYALDFLGALTEFVNNGFPENYFKREDNHYPYASYRYPWYANGEWTYEQEDDIRDNDIFSLFNIDSNYFDEWLNYEGCGTSTIQQLNILYNIDQ